MKNGFNNFLQIRAGINFILLYFYLFSFEEGFTTLLCFLLFFGGGGNVGSFFFFFGCGIILFFFFLNSNLHCSKLYVLVFTFLPFFFLTLLNSHTAEKNQNHLCQYGSYSVEAPMILVENKTFGNITRKKDISLQIIRKHTLEIFFFLNIFQPSAFMSLYMCMGMQVSTYMFMLVLVRERL